jgi:hypothetical protein
LDHEKPPLLSAVGNPLLSSMLSFSSLGSSLLRVMVLSEPLKRLESGPEDRPEDDFVGIIFTDAVMSFFSWAGTLKTLRIKLASKAY